MKISTLTIAAIITFSAASSWAGGAVGRATEMTQLANNTELGAIYKTELDTMKSNMNQLNQQIAMYKNMLQNTISLPEHIWSDAMGDIIELRQIVQRTGALAQSAGDLDQYMKTTYSDYNTFSQSRSTINYGDEYQKWSSASQSALVNSLTAANMTFDQVDSEGAFVAKLQAASQSAEGQKQALQAANQVAIEQVKQIQKLRSLVATQMQAQGEFMAKQNATEDYFAARTAAAVEASGRDHSGSNTDLNTDQFTNMFK